MDEKEMERKLIIWTDQVLKLAQAINQMDIRLKKVEKIFDGFVRSLERA